MIDYDFLGFIGAIILMYFFSAKAVQAEQRLWRKCRRKDSCLRLQQQITKGKSHCR